MKGGLFEGGLNCFKLEISKQKGIFKVLYYKILKRNTKFNNKFDILSKLIEWMNEIIIIIIINYYYNEMNNYKRVKTIVTCSEHKKT